MTRTRSSRLVIGIFLVLSMIFAFVFSSITANAAAEIDLMANGSSATVNGAVWENLVPHTSATGTGTFHSFLRVQNNGTERGYNHGLSDAQFDEKTSFTDPMLLSNVPTVEYAGAMYREFQLDINENDDNISMDRFQVWLTNTENLLNYDITTYSFGSDARKVYDSVGYILKLAATGGSGKREYRVLIPVAAFANATEMYVVLFTEHGITYSTSDGFEEWGVEKQTETLPSIDVVKTALTTSLAEPGGWVTYKVDILNTSDSTDPITINSLTDVVEGGTPFNISGIIYNDQALTLPTAFPFTILSGATKTVYFRQMVTGEPRTVLDVVTASGVDDENLPVSDFDDASVTVTNVLPIIQVTKTATPTSVIETGQDVLFTFNVHNLSIEPVTLTSLTDSVYGTLTGDADCEVGTVLAAGASCEFSFTRWVEGDYSGPDHVDVFTAHAVDNDGSDATDNDDAIVDFSDVPPTIMVTKTANATSIPFSGANVTFKFVVMNTSSEEAVTILSLNDSVFGVLAGDADCMVGTILAAGASCEFEVTVWVEGEAGSTHTNTFTAVAEDNDGTDARDDDDETIKLFWYGFTPGYWKTHPEEWIRTDYMTTTTVRSVFAILDSRYLTGDKLDLNKDGKEDTLMDALNYQGGNDLKGKLQILLRAAVAGILNESALGDYYPPYDSTTELINAVNVAIASTNKGTITSLAMAFDYWNNGIHMFPEP